VCCSVLQRVVVSSVLRCLFTGSTASLVSATFLEVAGVLQLVAVSCYWERRIAGVCYFS